MSDHFTILRSKGLNLQTLIASYFPSVTLELVLLLDDSYNDNKLILGIKEKEKWVASANFTKSKKNIPFFRFLNLVPYQRKIVLSTLIFKNSAT